MNTPVAPATSASPCQYSRWIDVLDQHAVKQPSRLAYTFLLDGDDSAETLTFSELYCEAKRIAALLQANSATGERAILLYTPGLDFVKALFGCLIAGVIAVPVFPPNLTRPERTLPRFLSIANDAQPKFVVTTSAIAAKAQNLLFGEAGTFSWIITDDLSQGFPNCWTQPNLDSNSIALLQYTSGSTGQPKGTILTQGNLLHNSEMISVAFRTTTESTGVSWLPFYHDMGLIGGVLQPAYVGFPVVLMSPLDFLQRPIRWLRAISRYQATVSGGPNFAYDLCVRKIVEEQIGALNLSSWAVAFTGAEPIRGETLQQFADKFRSTGFSRNVFFPCYGQAEATLMISGRQSPTIIQCNADNLEQNILSMDDASNKSRALVSCGQTFLEQEIAIVNPDTLTRCPEGHVGEIWVRGPSIAQGYWNNSQSTAETFNAYVNDTAQGPFLRTGDLGVIHNDELFITGRLKDLIIIDGRNHYPQDIELSVAQSISLAPNNCAAFSTEINDRERLIILAEIPRTAYSISDLHSIIGRIRQAVSEHHLLQAHAIVLLKSGALPKTSSGKIRRRACRESFLENSFKEVIFDFRIEVAATGVPSAPTIKATKEDIT